jgi:hypothetical protein
MSLLRHLTTIKKFFQNYEVEVCFKIKGKNFNVVPRTSERKFPLLTEVTTAVSVLTVLAQ